MQPLVREERKRCSRGQPAFNASSYSPPCRQFHAQRHSKAVYFTITTDEGVSPASFSVLDMSKSPWNVLRGNVVVKVVTGFPVSLCICCASSNSVVSAGSVFMILPESVCSFSFASVWSAFGRGAAAAAAGAAAAEEEDAASGALPSRAALASSALRRRLALSSSILALIRFLASASSSFSLRFCAASLICSFRASSSFASWDSFVDFCRIFYAHVRVRDDNKDQRG